MIIPKDRPLRILLSNDDGISAPGLKTLEKIAHQLSDDVWVVAPETEQSGVGHSLSLRRPLRLRHLSPQKYAVDGTPTDCMVIALKEILKDNPPDLVLSGVNNGGNLAEDVTYSGTVAAAMEATLLGVPAIALSQVKEHNHPVKWSTAEHFAPDIIRKLIEKSWPKNVLININFPNRIVESVTGVRVCEQGQREFSADLKEWMDPRGEPYYWLGIFRHHEHKDRSTDLWAVQNGKVSVTPLHLNLSHRETLSNLKTVFGETD